MKTHRLIIIISGLLCLILLFLSWVCFARYSENEWRYYEFLYTLSLGVFTSSLVVLITSILSCSIARERAISSIVARVIKIQRHYENVLILVNPPNRKSEDEHVTFPNIETQEFLKAVSRLQTALLWAPRSERIAWFSSSKPPNITFSTHLQRVEFGFVKSCFLLLDLCNNYLNCHRKSLNISEGNQGKNNPCISGCLVGLVNFFTENDFISASNDYLKLIIGKKNF